MTWSPRPSKNALEQTIDGLVANDSFVARHCGTTTTCMTCIICITLQHNMHHTATQHASHCNTACITLQHNMHHTATQHASHCNTTCITLQHNIPTELACLQGCHGCCLDSCACMLSQSKHAHVCCLSPYVRMYAACPFMRTYAASVHTCE